MSDIVLSDKGEDPVRGGAGRSVLRSGIVVLNGPQAASGLLFVVKRVNFPFFQSPIMVVLYISALKREQDLPHALYPVSVADP